MKTTHTAKAAPKVLRYQGKIVCTLREGAAFYKIGAYPMYGTPDEVKVYVAARAHLNLRVIKLAGAPSHLRNLLDLATVKHAPAKPREVLASLRSADGDTFILYDVTGETVRVTTREKGKKPFTQALSRETARVVYRAHLDAGYTLASYYQPSAAA